MVLARLLLQADASELLPQRPEDFCKYAAQRLQSVAPVYNPLTRRMGPCLNVNSLYSVMVPLRARMTACCARRQGRGSRQSLSQQVLGWCRGRIDSATSPSFDQ